MCWRRVLPFFLHPFLSAWSESRIQRLRSCRCASSTAQSQGVGPSAHLEEEGRAYERPSVTCRTAGLAAAAALAASASGGDGWSSVTMNAHGLDTDSLRCVSLSKSFTEHSADSRQDYYLLQCVRQTVSPLNALIFDAHTHRYAWIPCAINGILAVGNRRNVICMSSLPTRQLWSFNSSRPNRQRQTVSCSSRYPISNESVVLISAPSKKRRE